MQNDQFGDFLSQLPPGPFILVCGSTLLLMFAVFYIGYLRPLLRNRASVTQTPEPAHDAFTAATVPDVSMDSTLSAESPAPAPETSTNADADHDDPFDLPDLNALIDTTGLVDDTPEPEPELSPPPVPPAAREPIQAAPTPVSPPPSSPQPTPSQGQEQLNAGEHIIELNTGVKVKAEEVVTVLRDARDGRLVVRVEGTGYRTLLDSPDVKKQFVAVMKELSTVVTEPDDNPPEADVVVESVATVQPSPPPPKPAPPSQTSAPKPTTSEEPLPGDLPKFDLEESVTPKQGGLFSGRLKYEAQPVPELDIAGSIEAYLQYKLSATAAYPGREIHVHSAPGGGVRIQVDQTFYEAVSDVADDEVREFLSSTIAEWQERQ